MTISAPRSSPVNGPSSDIWEDDGTSSWRLSVTAPQDPVEPDRTPDEEPGDEPAGAPDPTTPDMPQPSSPSSPGTTVPPEKVDPVNVAVEMSATDDIGDIGDVEETATAEWVQGPAPRLTSIPAVGPRRVRCRRSVA